jgi:hypothetical protein
MLRLLPCTNRENKVDVSLTFLCFKLFCFIDIKNNFLKIIKYYFDASSNKYFLFKNTSK